MNSYVEVTTIPKCNVLVIDLEATCSEDKNISGSNMEVIEIGAVWVSCTGNILHTFQSFVRPVVNKILTPFCTQLTKIAQDQIDGAPTLDQIAGLLQAFSLETLKRSAYGALRAAAIGRNLSLIYIDTGLKI